MDDIDTQIAAAVERARKEHLDTKELYRAVCGILFIDFGRTPTVNLLYSLVKKGSMAVPTAVLADFWRELRKKSRLQLDNKGFPDELRNRSAEFLSRMWEDAQDVAACQLSSLRDEVTAQLATAERQREAAVLEANQHRAATEALQTRVEQAAADLTASQTELEAECRAHAATAARHIEVQRTCDDLRNQLDRQRAEFNSELARLREAVDAADERANAVQRRALLEIDQERQACARAEKVLETHRTQSAQAEERRRVEVQRLTEDNARLQATVGSATAAADAAAVSVQGKDTRIAELELAVQTSERLGVQYRAEADTLRAVLERLGPAASSSTKGSRTKRGASGGTP